MMIGTASMANLEEVSDEGDQKAHIPSDPGVHRQTSFPRRQRKDETAKGETEIFHLIEERTKVEEKILLRQDIYLLLLASMMRGIGKRTEAVVTKTGHPLGIERPEGIDRTQNEEMARGNVNHLL